MVRTIYLLAFLSLVIFKPNPLEAQTGSGSGENTENTGSEHRSEEEIRHAARNAYTQGQELYRQGRFEEAEQSFQEAYTLIPNPIVLLGIAEARQRAGNIVGAVESFELYLVERSNAPDREQIERRVTELRTTPATLVLSSDPAGVRIQMEGEANELTTPTEVEVPAGTHSLIFSLEGYESTTRRVDAIFGTQHEIRVEMVEETIPEADPEPTNIEPEFASEDPPLGEEGETPDEQQHSDLSVAVWTATGIAAASLVTGTVLGFMAFSREAEFEDSPRAETADQGERFALFADVFFGLAAASALTAIVLFLTDKEEEEPEESQMTLRLTPILSPRSGGVGAHLSF